MERKNRRERGVKEREGRGRGSNIGNRERGEINSPDHYTLTDNTIKIYCIDCSDDTAVSAH
jgi:hypothetical protein